MSVFEVVDDGEMRFGIRGNVSLFRGDEDVKGDVVVGGVNGNRKFVVLLIELGRGDRYFDAGGMSGKDKGQKD